MRTSAPRGQRPSTASAGCGGGCRGGLRHHRTAAAAALSINTHHLVWPTHAPPHASPSHALPLVPQAAYYTDKRPCAAVVEALLDAGANPLRAFSGPDSVGTLSGLALAGDAQRFVEATMGWLTRWVP